MIAHRPSVTRPPVVPRPSQLDTASIRLLSGCCHATLTDLNISDCPRLSSASLGWIGGTLGFKTPACARLVTLSCHNCGDIGDGGLVHLGAGGMRSLRNVDFSDCSGITDEGIAALVRRGSKLRLMNISHNAGLSDRCLRSIGRKCAQLRSLNISRCVRMGDRGLAHLAKGCKHLQVCVPIPTLRFIQSTLQHSVLNVRGNTSSQRPKCRNEPANSI